jgi:hypothetical protein
MKRGTNEIAIPRPDSGHSTFNRVYNALGIELDISNLEEGIYEQNVSDTSIFCELNQIRYFKEYQHTNQLVLQMWGVLEDLGGGGEDAF